ncbi:formate dehydrogenase accessory sulfurtransferase FdhD [Robbsia sp. Bb-Pol-6]|uniref:Sulfur carrier protein FdhD n=1 Tax=Robbsia betulipollinis TaxID=2981849 RepID=A0ABT3ZLC7_9BURK|nr:formate dehydrogenase accessory sulfurtransferase FdhD [Robbsia betulipollinis]MCY0387334.1 formate dehydrogenase accessory sulfurtransferase FdhD [Robbsia betulipollinis]
MATATTTHMTTNAALSNVSDVSDNATDDTSPSPGWRRLPVLRHRAGAHQPADDQVAEEWPVALVFNGISHAVMMTTPRDLEAFAVGFSLSEGIVRSIVEIRDIETTFHEESAEVAIELLQGAFVGLKDKRRSLVGRTGCGVCGIESLALLDLEPERIAEAGNAGPTAASAIDDAAIQRAARELRPRQTLMQQTGGVHAAAWCGRDGEILRAFEDVGRHNALDKLIGQLARDRTDFGSGFVFMSSRASYELVRKAARVGIPMLATISAPTSLAVRIAEKAGIRLASFCRDDGFVEYAGADMGTAQQAR